MLTRTQCKRGPVMFFGHTKPPKEGAFIDGAEGGIVQDSLRVFFHLGLRCFRAGFPRIMRSSLVKPANATTLTYNQKKPPKGRFFRCWRWARDSNPGNLSVQRFSRPPLSTTQPAHQNLSRLPPREAPHYSDASLTIKLPVRYFPRNLRLRQVPRVWDLSGRWQHVQDCW